LPLSCGGMHEIATVGASVQKENKRAVWQLVHGCERLSPPSRLPGIGKTAGSPPSNVVNGTAISPSQRLAQGSGSGPLWFVACEDGMRECLLG
jgi:hypothetical protein